MSEGLSAEAIAANARAAWRAYGVELPDGEGPLQMDIGMSPVRIEPDGAAEVVWCRRVDPCRARILNVPTPESGRRYGDLVLHDGEPRGKRTMDGRQFSFFDELMLLEESPFGTWLVELEVASPDALAAILDPLDKSIGAIELWSDSVRALCPACSLGEPHDHSEEPPQAGWSSRQRVGVAARSERELSPLRTWFGLRWRRGVKSVERVL